MRIIKHLIAGILIGIVIALFALICFIMSPLIISAYILNRAVKFEDDMMPDNYKYKPTIYVGEKGIEWDAVRP